MLKHRFDGIVLQPHPRGPDRKDIRQQYDRPRYYIGEDKPNRQHDDSGGYDHVHGDDDEPGDRSKAEFECLRWRSVPIRVIDEELAPDAP